MRRIIVTSFAAALFAAALPASAENLAANSNARGEPAAQQPRARQDGERQVCVREQLSDSRMRRRVCHTAREWEQLHGEDSAAR
jgi:hypothetical protein